MATTTTVVKSIFQLRRGTTDEWEQNKTVVPAAGEPCFDLDLGILKIGNGIDTYENLEPINGEGSGVTDTEINDLKNRVSTLEGNYTTVLNTIEELDNKINGTGNGTIDDIINTKISSYCTSNVVCGIKVNGTTLDAINGVVDISIPNQTLSVKESDEITIADDGTLGVGKIEISKIYQDVNCSLVLDCNV